MLRNLRSVIITQVTRGGRSAVPRRNISSSNRRRNFTSSIESEGEGMLSKVIGVTLGAYVGYRIIKGRDLLSKVEKERQEVVRIYCGDSEPIDDLKEMMWSEPMDDLWSDLKRMWADLIKEG